MTCWRVSRERVQVQRHEITGADLGQRQKLAAGAHFIRVIVCADNTVFPNVGEAGRSRALEIHRKRGMPHFALWSCHNGASHFENWETSVA